MTDGEGCSLDEYAASLERLLEEKRKLHARVQAPPSPPLIAATLRARVRVGTAWMASLHVARYAVRDPGPTRSCCCGVQTRLDALKAQLSNEEALSARIKQLPIY